MNNAPIVTVILPVFNGENYLRAAIESVLAQTLPDFELIVVDDGSTDTTGAIAQEYGPRVRYIHQANTGVAGAFNHGLKLAAGRYISWLSHDDVYAPTKLEKQVDALRRLGQPGVCYTDIQIIDHQHAVIGEHALPEYEREDLLRHVLTGGPICSASYSILYDRDCIRQVGAYAEEWRYTQDVEMLARLARRFPFVRVPEKLMQVRETENRGIHSPRWRREVVKFYRTQLSTAPIEELFPGLSASKQQRAQAYQWLGDTLAGQPFPIYRVAAAQYWRALRADWRGFINMFRKIAWIKRHYLWEEWQRRARTASAK